MRLKWSSFFTYPVRASCHLTTTCWTGPATRTTTDIRIRYSNARSSVITSSQTTSRS